MKNLDDQVQDEALREAFVPFGNITSAKVMIDDKGASRGFGFVCFAVQEEATKAVAEMNGHILGNKPLYVALAQRKDERKNMLEQQHQTRSGPAAGRMSGGAVPQGQMYQPMNQMPFYGQMGQQQGGRGFMYPQQQVRHYTSSIARLSQALWRRRCSVEPNIYTYHSNQPPPRSRSK